MSRECGFNQIVPKLWIEPVHGVVPGHGFHIDWLGLWFDIAEGVSVQNIQVGPQGLKGNFKVCMSLFLCRKCVQCNPIM
jgi:hypothetical protein